MSRVASAFVLALGMAGAGSAVAYGLVVSRAPARTVTVKGLAERNVDSDLAIWSMPFVATGSDLGQVQREVEEDHDRVMDFLTSGGLSASEISLQVQLVEDRLANAYQNGLVQSRYIVRRTLLVRTEKVDVVQSLSQKTGRLVDQGVVLGSNMGPDALQPTFLFTRLNEIKPDMISEATKNGSIAAERFAEDAGADLGSILDARQGLFQILARDKAPQLREEKQRQKTIRVVSTFRFELE